MTTKAQKPRIPADLMAAPATAAAVGRGQELPLAKHKKDGKGIKGSTVGTTLYLVPHEAKRLKRLAIDIDRSLHDLIQDGLDLLLAQHGQPRIERYKGN